MKWSQLAVASAVLAALLAATPLGAQSRPNFTGIWRLDCAESRMIGRGDGRPAPDCQIRWTVDHREPTIRVLVEVGSGSAQREFTFRCTTDGAECVNELPSLNEVRRLTARWKDGALVMDTKAQSPHGNFDALDRLSISDDGQTLTFHRTVRDAGGERISRQVFRRVTPRPRPPTQPQMPSVALPPELDRVLRDYERAWASGDEAGLAALFTEDGFILGPGSQPLRGRDAIRTALASVGSPLALRALAFAADDTVGYIIGVYARPPDTTDVGKFILALRRRPGGPWLIAADFDSSNRPRLSLLRPDSTVPATPRLH